MGGHGFESIYNTIFYGKHGFDGVIHLMPLSCMPESTVEVLVDQMAHKYEIPLYRFPIDENNFEAGFNTRLETFVSMLRRKKKNEVLSRH
jgi:predicted nucleotide-binding protein (sugar kinase/HSP70/actin superfamily)